MVTDTNKDSQIAVRTETVLSSYKDVVSMATAFIKSGFFQDAKDAAQAIVKIQAGRELGFPAVYAMQHINMIKGRLTTDANSMALMVKTSGKYNYRIVKHDEMLCTIAFFESEAGKWVEVGKSTFTIEDAKRAQLVKPDSGWAKYPRAMLFSRAISQGARMYCPDAIGGVYTHEEMQSEIPPMVELEEVKPAGNIESTAKVLQNPEEETVKTASKPAAETPKPTYGEALTWCAKHHKDKKWFLDNCGFTERELLDEPVKVETAIQTICQITGWKWEMPTKGGV